MFCCGYHTPAQKNSVTGATVTVMALSIQVILQVALLCCVVTTSMAGIPDWRNELSQLEKKVEIQQEEIKSLHQIIEQVEKRLKQLEMKGEFDEVQVQPVGPTLHSC